MASDYYEPWRARKSTAWQCGFRFPPDREDMKAEWEASKAKAERDAPWHLIGVGVWEPGEAVCLESGEQVKVDSTGIIAVIRRLATERGRLDAEAFARRIAACINFCMGVDLSESGFSTLREALTEIETLRGGMSREIVNQWWKPKLEPEPEVFPDMGAPQGPKVRKPRHQKPPKGVVRGRNSGAGNST